MRFTSNEELLNRRDQGRFVINKSEVHVWVDWWWPLTEEKIQASQQLVQKKNRYWPYCTLKFSLEYFCFPDYKEIWEMKIGTGFKKC